MITSIRLCVEGLEELHRWLPEDCPYSVLPGSYNKRPQEREIKFTYKVFVTKQTTSSTLVNHLNSEASTRDICRALQCNLKSSRGYIYPCVKSVHCSQRVATTRNHRASGTLEVNAYSTKRLQSSFNILTRAEPLRRILRRSIINNREQ